jgi:threonine dehydrogenase-like Zn-dependent dehydrogenase
VPQVTVPGRAFGPEERGNQGVARVRDLTIGLGAHSLIEAVGTQESMMQAVRSTRPGGHVGYVGVLHDVELPGEEMFFSHVHLHGGPAPVRRFLPELVDLIWNREIDPGKVFDLTLPLEEVAGVPRHGRAPRHQGAALALRCASRCPGGMTPRGGNHPRHDRVR